MAKDVLQSLVSASARSGFLPSLQTPAGTLKVKDYVLNRRSPGALRPENPVDVARRVEEICADGPKRK
jgi:hypothetical protein